MVPSSGDGRNDTTVRRAAPQAMSGNRANRRAVVRRQHPARLVAQPVAQVGRPDQLGVGRQSHHQPHQPLRVADAQRHLEPVVGQLGLRLDRVVLRDPARDAVQPDGRRAGRPGRARRGPTDRSRGRHVVLERGLVEHLQPGDPVEPEQPPGLREVAPGVEVGVPFGLQQGQRVDDALGGLVAGRHVVLQPHLASAVDRLAEPGRAPWRCRRRATAPRPRRPPSRRRWRPRAWPAPGRSRAARSPGCPRASRAAPPAAPPPRSCPSRSGRLR